MITSGEEDIMMDYGTMQSMMGGGDFGGFGIAWFFMWLTYIFVIALLALGIAALIKYIGKK